MSDLPDPSDFVPDDKPETDEDSCDICNCTPCNCDYFYESWKDFKMEQRDGMYNE